MPNQLGQKIVDNYNASGNQTPGGSCFDVAYARVNEASRQVCSSALPSLNAFAAFDRLWGIKIDPLSTWLRLPEQYRGKGSAGAMASISKGTLVESSGIWSGGLLPGAVVQTWELTSDFESVKMGNAASQIGHSFIFLSYVKQDGTIVGMKLADQGFISGQTVTSTRFQYWVGANLNC